MSTPTTCNNNDLEESALAPKAKYQTGAVTLREIGSKIGGVSATMVTKITASAQVKLLSLTNGKLPERLSSDEEVELDIKLAHAMRDAVNSYVDLLKASSAHIDEFLTSLKHKRFISSSEMINISDEEIEALVYLSRLESRDEINRTLRADISCQDNVFKTFQSTYSRTLFPAPRRGRPKKPSNL